jgi:hypothetical protein
MEKVNRLSKLQKLDTSHLTPNSFYDWYSLIYCKHTRMRISAQTAVPTEAELKIEHASQFIHHRGLKLNEITVPP